MLLQLESGCTLKIVPGVPEYISRQKLPKAKEKNHCTPWICRALPTIYHSIETLDKTSVTARIIALYGTSKATGTQSIDPRKIWPW